MVELGLVVFLVGCVWLAIVFPWMWLVYLIGIGYMVMRSED